MKNLKNLLQKPSQNHKLWVFWIWNKLITEDEIAKQIHEFNDKGFGGIAIRPSRDMQPKYFSEEFLKLFGKTLKIAKSLNLRIRLADDFSIPWSGFFQEHAQNNSSFRAQRLVLIKSYLLTSKDTFEYEIPDKHKYTILAVKSNNGKINLNFIKNLQTGLKTSSLSWKAPAGEWQVMIFKKEWYLDPVDNYVPNVFNPKVMQTYSQYVLEQLYERFEKYIPLVLEGFICEMPTYLPSKDGIPWDDDLIIKYRSRYKKNLLNVIPSLYFEVDDCFAKNRSHVYNFILQAMYERFPLALETWAKKFNLSQWVLCPERDINWDDDTLKDVMAIPGANVSSIGIQNHDGTEANYAVIKAMADMNSIEYKRETIAVIGRNRKGISATLQSLKSEIDQHAFLETSKIILDGCFFNLDQRSYIKTPFNPFWYHPDWEHMRYLCDYSARLLSFSNILQRPRAVAVIMPSLSVMADYLPSNDEYLRKGMQLFHEVVTILQSKRIEFDIVSEHFLVSCTLKTNGEFGTSAQARKDCYRAVLFPFSRLINNSTFVFLEKLAAKKGIIIFINESPQGNFDDGQSPSFTSRVIKLTKPKNDTVHVVGVNEFLPKLDFINKSIKIISKGGSFADIQITEGCGVDYSIFFIANKSTKRDYYVSFELPLANHVYFVDCYTGSFHEIENIQLQETCCNLNLNFAPQQSYILLTSDAKIYGVYPGKGKKHCINSYGTLNKSYRIMLKDKWSFTHDKFNILPLASWNTRIGLSRDVGGFSHFCEAYFESEEVPEVCFLTFPGIIERKNEISKDIEISVNGIILDPFKTINPEDNNEATLTIRDFCGSTTLKYNIKEAVMKGINRISLRSVGLLNEPSSIFYPPIVAGYFSIKKGSRGWTMDTKNTEAQYGSWTKHGFPYFSGTGIYQQFFEIPTEYNRIILMFKKTSGSVLVEVNGITYDVINWQPMAVDITEAIEPRRNVLKVRVVNTVDNLLRMNGRASGLIGEVFLDIF